MKQLVRNRKGQVVFEDIPRPIVSSGRVLVRVLYSAISTGTETRGSDNSFNFISKLNPDYAARLSKKIIEVGSRKMYYRLKNKLISTSPIGYSVFGIVIDRADDVRNISIGDRVVCGGAGYVSHAEILSVPQNLVSKVSDLVEGREAAFAAIGAIAIHAVHQADLRMGESCVVVGLGLIGQMVAQILKLSGIKVFGLDISTKRITLAKKAGITAFSVADAEKINFITTGHGVDSAIICAASKDEKPVITACNLLRERGKLVVVGHVKLNIPYAVFFRKELTVLASRSMGPGRFDENYESKNIDYPYQFVRWTEKRNIEEFLNLLENKTVNMKLLIEEEHEFSKAQEAFTRLAKNELLGVVLRYDAEKTIDLSKKIVLQQKINKDKLGVGVAGLGNFAQNLHIPNILQNGKFDLRAVCSNDGLRAKHLAKLFKANYCTTDYESMLTDPEIDLVFITSRNSAHAEMAIRAARAKKSIFLEKPMAVNYKECKELVKEIQKNKVNFTLGLNRRFSPFVKIIKEYLVDRNEPLLINYRINEDRKAEKYWTEDFREGGRIVHMGCHVADFCTYLIGSEPKTIFAESISAKGTINISEDNVAIISKFEDGSLLNMFYSMQGNSAMERERIEIYTNKVAIVISDFQEMQVYTNKSKKTFRLKTQDKGHETMLREFYAWLKGDKSANIVNLNDAIRSAIFCFKAIDSLKTKKPVNLNLENYFVNAN